MQRPRILVLTGYGINCEDETAYACNLPAVGGEAQQLHLSDLIAQPQRLDDFHMLVIPGGFAFGDDIAAGIVLATKLRYRLEQPLSKFLHDGKLVLGICNGFQALVRLGVLPAVAGMQWRQEATLTANDSGKFEDRWVHMRVNSSCPSPFVQGIERLYLPVRHGEGKFVPRDAGILQALHTNHQIAACYCGPDGQQRRIPGIPMAQWTISLRCVIPAAASSDSCRTRKPMCTAPTIRAGRVRPCQKKAWACRSFAMP